MKFACLSLAVLLLASLVISENIWERDENNYNEVMKNLNEEQNAKKEVVGEEHSEEKKADKPKAAKDAKSKGKVDKPKAKIQVKIKLGAANKDSKTEKKPKVKASKKITVKGSKKAMKWTSSFLSSWSTGPRKIRFYTSVFKLSKSMQPKKVKVKKPRIIITTGVSYNLEKEIPWTYEFKLATCECDEYYLAANDWLDTQLLLWEKAVAKLYRNVYKMSLKLKKLGSGWLLSVDDNKYKMWIEWVSYLEKMRVKFITMGRAAFLKAYEDKVKGRLEAMTMRLRGVLLRRTTEASDYLSGKVDGDTKATFGKYRFYRSKRLRVYHIMTANLWRRSETAKFNALLARVYRKALAWYKKRGVTYKWWWTSFVKVINGLYRKFIGFLQMWYRQFRVRGHGWYTKYLKIKWLSFVQIVTEKVRTLTESLFSTSSVKVITSAVKMKVSRTMTGVMKTMTRFEVRSQSKIQQIFREGQKQVVTRVSRRVGWWLEMEPDWSVDFNVEVCDCGSNILTANSWMTVQMVRWESHIRTIKQRVRTWYKKNKLCGKGWIKKAKDIIYNVWIKYVKFIDDYRTQIVSSESTGFVSSVNVKVAAKLKQLRRELNEQILVLILRGRQLLQDQPGSIIHYTYKHKLRYRLISANIWRRELTTRFRSHLAGYVRMAKAWYKKYGGELTWWWTVYNGLIKDIYSQYINLVKIYFDGIRQYGYRWFRKYSSGKWRKFIRILKKKIKQAHRVIFVRSQKKLTGEVTDQMRTNFVDQVKVIKQGFVGLNTRLQKKLLIFVEKGFDLQPIKSKTPTLQTFSKAGWTLDAPKKWITKFNHFKGWKSTQKDLTANKWVAKQLKKWGKKVRNAKKRISTWFKQHKKIGKWWIVKATDDVHEFWGDWANYLYKMRDQFLKSQTVDDRVSLESEVKSKLDQLILKLQNRIDERISEGRRALEWQLVSKVPSVKTYKSRFLHKYLTMKSNVWRLHETAKFQASFKSAHQDVLKKLKKYKFSNKKWMSAYLKIVALCYENFEKLINLWYKEIVARGKGWYLKYLHQQWTKVIRIVIKRIRSLLDSIFQLTSSKITTTMKSISKKKINFIVKRIRSLSRLFGKFSKRMIRKSEKIFRNGLRIAAKPSKIKKFLREMKDFSEFSIENCQCGEVDLAANNWMHIQMKRWRVFSRSIVASIHAWYKRNHQIGRWWLVKAMNAVNKIWIEYVSYLERLRKKYLSLRSSDHSSLDSLAREKLNILLGGLREALRIRFKQCGRRLREGGITVKEIKAATCEVNKSHLKQKVRDLSAKIWQRKHLTEYKALLKQYVITVKKFIRPFAHKLRWWWKMYERVVNKMNNCLTGLAKVNSKAIRLYGHRFFARNVRNKYQTHLQTVVSQLADVNRGLLAHLTTRRPSKHAVRKHFKSLLSVLSKTCVTVKRKVTFLVTASYRKEKKAQSIKKTHKHSYGNKGGDKRKTGYWLGSQSSKRKERLRISGGRFQPKHKVTDIVVISPRRSHKKRVRVTSGGRIVFQGRRDEEPCDDDKSVHYKHVTSKKPSGFWLGSQGLKRKQKGGFYKTIQPRGRFSFKVKTGNVGRKVHIKQRPGSFASKEFKQQFKTAEEPCEDDKSVHSKIVTPKKRTGFWLGSQGLKRKQKGGFSFKFKVPYKPRPGRFDFKLPRLPKLKTFQTREFKPRFDLFEKDICTRPKTGFWLGAQGNKRKQKIVVRPRPGRFSFKVPPVYRKKPSRKFKFRFDLFGKDICSRKPTRRLKKKCLRRVKKAILKRISKKIKREQKLKKKVSPKPKRTGFWLGAEKLKRKKKSTPKKKKEKKAKVCRTDSLGFITRCQRFRESLLQREIRNICSAVAFSHHIGLLKKVLCSECSKCSLNVEKQTKIIKTPQGKLACHPVGTTPGKSTPTKPKANCYWLGPERLRRRRKPRRRPRGSLPKLPKIEFKRYRKPSPLPPKITVRCSEKSKVVRVKSEKRTKCVPTVQKAISCTRREYRQCRAYRPNRCCPTDFLGEVLKNRKVTVNIVNINACDRACGDRGVKRKFFVGKRRLVCECQ